MGVDQKTETIAVRGGTIEVVRIEGDRAPVLFFPGGHCRTASDCGWDLYTDLGHALIAFSRPGYGATTVGPLSPAEFAPLTAEVCERLGATQIAAAVGVSFGGMQAVEVARAQSSVRGADPPGLDRTRRRAARPRRR